MCRWLDYSGSPIVLDELLYKTDHSLIDQSLHARLGVDRHQRFREAAKPYQKLRGRHGRQRAHAQR